MLPVRLVPEGDAGASLPRPASPADPVDVLLHVLREVEVVDVGDLEGKVLASG